MEKLNSNRDKNFLIKFVFWLDKHTDLLGKLERNRAEWLLENFPIHQWLNDSERILDVGSGIGDIATKINQFTGNSVFGVDYVDYRRKEIKGLNKYHYIKGDAYNLSFKDKTFESVLILVTLHHMKSPEEAIKESLRVLKHNGYLIILEDLVGPKGSWLRFITLLVDNVINLTLEGNPNSNKTGEEWSKLLGNNLALTKVKETSLKWGPFFKSLELGLFLYQKP